MRKIDKAWLVSGVWHCKNKQWVVVSTIKVRYFHVGEHRRMDGYVKCNYDGGWSSINTRARAGWIIRDSFGSYQGAGQVAHGFGSGVAPCKRCY